MQKNILIFISLLVLSVGSFSALSATAQSGSPEGLSIPMPVSPSPEVSPAPAPVSTTEALLVASGEVRPLSSEARTASGEVYKPFSSEGISVIISVEANKPATPEVSYSSENLTDGSSYKGVPWGCDFNGFKRIKNFSGSLGFPSAAFVNSPSDNDIALLLNVPVSSSNGKKEQRVRFECVPQKFASVYYQPDDVYYVFYNGKFSLVFSNLIAKNFELYRDNFYKKYDNTGLVTKQYAPSNKRKYRIDALQFERGETLAFLIKAQDTTRNQTSVSAKMVLFSNEAFLAIQKEIKDKISSEAQQKNLNLENDLNKIE